MSRQSTMKTFLSRTQRSFPFVTRQKLLRGRLVGDYQHVGLIGNVVLAENFGIQWNPFSLGLPCTPLVKHFEAKPLLKGIRIRRLSLACVVSVRKGREVNLGARPRVRDKGGDERVRLPPSSRALRAS